MPENDETTFRPSDVARELKVTANTVRNWAKRYSDYLSDGAKPTGNAERAFNHRDLTILHYVNQHVNEGYTHDYIAKRLPETTFSDDEVILPPNPPELPQTAQEPPGATLAPTVGIDALSPLLTAMQENFVSAERLRAVSDEQRQQRADLGQIRLLLYALLVIMVLVLVAVVLLVAVMR